MSTTWSAGTTVTNFDVRLFQLSQQIRAPLLLASDFVALPGFAWLGLLIKCRWNADYSVHEGGHQQPCCDQVLCSLPAGRQLYCVRRGAPRNVAQCCGMPSLQPSLCFSVHQCCNSLLHSQRRLCLLALQSLDTAQAVPPSAVDTWNAVSASEKYAPACNSHCVGSTSNVCSVVDPCPFLAEVTSAEPGAEIRACAAAAAVHF